VDRGQRFTAKPGTTRENAVALTSNKRPDTAVPAESSAWNAGATEDDSPLTVKSLSTPSEKPRSGPAHDRAVEALNSASPETGLRLLNSALALPHDSGQAALLYEAMGQLYAQSDPPDFDRAASAFEAALARAEDPDLAQEIRLKSAQVLMQGGLDEQALAQLDGDPEPEALSTGTQFRLHLLRGQLEERAGRAAEAEQIYRDVLEAALALPDGLSRDGALDMARLAGLRLSGLYRAQDQAGNAETLARELKRQLKILEDAA